MVRAWVPADRRNERGVQARGELPHVRTDALTRRPPLQQLLVVGVLALLVMQAPALAVRSSTPAGNLPRLMLWAWERPEDLRGIAADTGVAYLAQTITIRGDRVAILPRRQPLRISPASTLVA